MVVEILDPAQTQTMPADLVDSGASAFCHITCGISDDQTLCGLTDESDNWCGNDPCDNVCLVCLDLESASPCPVCGTDCTDESEAGDDHR